MALADWNERKGKILLFALLEGLVDESINQTPSAREGYKRRVYSYVYWVCKKRLWRYFQCHGACGDMLCVWYILNYL